MSIQIMQGDCCEVMATLAESSVDAIVCDPPYELGFMGKKWDGTGVAFNRDTWRAALRVLKPGGHLLAFSGTRTYHRMVSAIEDAGFEIRDQIGWLYGSGFPKSLDVSKAIDKARDDRADILGVTTFMADAAERAGITRADVDAAMGTSDMGGWWLSRLPHRCQCPKWDQWVRLKALLALPDDMDAEVWRLNGRKGTPGEAWQTAEVLAVERRMNEASGIVSAGRDERTEVERQIKAANSDAARQWQGWGTALKPAWEPIVLARKPLMGTVAANVLQHGTGALNIDGCRVGDEVRTYQSSGAPGGNGQRLHGGDGRDAGNAKSYGERSAARGEQTAVGRWPANVIHDGSDEVLAAFPEARAYCQDPETAKAAQSRRVSGKGATAQAWGYADKDHRPLYADSGSAARFFYSAKADQRDRSDGLQSVTASGKNHHPTVKPTDLMRYLCRLVTPPGGLVLDPFMGSGSTLKAAELEGFSAIGIELDPAYIEIARRRIAADAPLFAEVTLQA